MREKKREKEYIERNMTKKMEKIIEINKNVGWKEGIKMKEEERKN